jgi:hypothetical protein
MTDVKDPAGHASARKPKAEPRGFSGAGGSGGVGPSIVELRHAPASLRLYATNDFERKYRARACDREPWTVAWLDSHVQPGDVVFDIGANVGPFSLIAAVRVGANGRVFAFEPGYASFARLCDNIVLNEFDDRIVPIPMPLAAATVSAAVLCLQTRRPQSTVQAPDTEPRQAGRRRLRAGGATGVWCLSGRADSENNAGGDRSRPDS